MDDDDDDDDDDGKMEFVGVNVPRQCSLTIPVQADWASSEAPGREGQVMERELLRVGRRGNKLRTGAEFCVLRAELERNFDNVGIFAFGQKILS
jgi:hypothetical protein